jgi:hypothetical protein
MSLLTLCAYIILRRIGIISLLTWLVNIALSIFYYFYSALAWFTKSSSSSMVFVNNNANVPAGLMTTVPSLVPSTVIPTETITEFPKDEL